MCVSVSEFDQTDTFATDSIAVNVHANAAKADGVKVANTTVKMRVTEVTFLNFSKIELFIRKKVIIKNILKLIFRIFQILQPTHY